MSAVPGIGDEWMLRSPTQKRILQLLVKPHPHVPIPSLDWAAFLFFFPQKTIGAVVDK